MPNKKSTRASEIDALSKHPKDSLTFAHCSHYGAFEISLPKLPPNA
jgi:hypothetical protein